MSNEGRMIKSADISREAIGFSAFRLLPNGTGRQYTACEMRRGWESVERFVRICRSSALCDPGQTGLTSRDHQPGR